MAMSPNRTLRVANTLLNYAVEDHGLAALVQEFAKPEHQALRQLLSKLAGDVDSETEPPSDLVPFRTSGTKVLYNGAEFRAIMFNLREAIGYDNWIMQWASPADLLRQLAIVQEIGGKGIRFYAAHQKLSAAEAAARAEHVLNLCHERGLFAIVALDEGAYSEFGIAKSSKNYRGRLTKAFYAGGYFDEYMPYVREVVKRIGNHPAIFCFEIANEPTLEIHPPDPTITELDQMLRWVKDASDLIREYAPHKLISPGWVSGNEMAGGHAYAGYKFAERVYNLENINLGCVHTYQGQRNLKWGDCQPNIEKEILIPNIPLYVGEIGLEPGLNDWGWVWRFANDPAIRDRFFLIAQWALMGHQGKDLKEVRQDFDIGTGDRVGMVQTYKNGMPGLYWTEYVHTYRELAKSSFG